jgi:hypothetical protein
MKKVKHTKYPVERCQQLVVAISQDLADQLQKLLRQHGLMHRKYVWQRWTCIGLETHVNVWCSISDFSKIVEECIKLDTTWTDLNDTLRQQLRDMQQVRTRRLFCLPYSYHASRPCVFVLHLSFLSSFAIRPPVHRHALAATSSGQKGVTSRLSTASSYCVRLALHPSEL